MESLYELLEDEKWAKFHIRVWTETLGLGISCDDVRLDLECRIERDKLRLREIQLAIKEQIQYYLDLK